MHGEALRISGNACDISKDIDGQHGMARNSENHECGTDVLPSHGARPLKSQADRRECHSMPFHCSWAQSTSDPSVC